MQETGIFQGPGTLMVRLYLLCPKSNVVLISTVNSGAAQHVAALALFLH